MQSGRAPSVITAYCLSLFLPVKCCIMVTAVLFQHTSENPPLSLKMMLYCVTAALLEVRPAVASDSDSEQHVLPAGPFSLLGHANLVTLNTGDIRIQDQDQRSDIRHTSHKQTAVESNTVALGPANTNMICWILIIRFGQRLLL